MKYDSSQNKSSTGSNSSPVPSKGSKTERPSTARKGNVQSDQVTFNKGRK